MPAWHRNLYASFGMFMHALACARNTRNVLSTREQQAGEEAATLTRVDAGPAGPSDDRREVSVVEHDMRRLTSQFQGEALVANARIVPI